MILGAEITQALNEPDHEGTLTKADEEDIQSND